MVASFSQINWLAVSVATGAHFIHGGVWFAALFSRQYFEALGITGQPPQKPRPMFIIGPLVCGGLTMATTAFLLRALAITGCGDAAALGAIVGIGYLGAVRGWGYLDLQPLSAPTPQSALFAGTTPMSASSYP